MSNRIKGVLCILFSALGFAFMNLFVPMAGDLPTIQKTLFRNLVALVVALLSLSARHRRQPVKEIKQPKLIPWKLMLMRVSFGTLGLFCNFYALDHLLISDASVLNKIAPFATLIFSALFLGEAMSRKHLYALGMAFIGVLLVSKPSLDSPNLWPYLIGIFGGMMAGAAYTCVRQLNKQGVTGAITIAMFSGFSSLVCLFLLLTGFQPMSFKQVMILLAAGIAASCGQFGITYAFKFAPASEISIFDYSAVVFTGILGYLFLKQQADLWSMLGYGLIFMATLFTFLYNRYQLRRNKTNFSKTQV